MNINDRDNLKLLVEKGIDMDRAEIAIEQAIDDDTLANLRIAARLFAGRPFTIILNSPGGDVFAGMGMIDVMKAHSAPITVLVQGIACSMACIILQAADRRLARPNAVLMHHVGSMELGSSDHFVNVKKLMDFHEKYSERINDLMLARVNEKRAKDAAAGKEDSKPRDMAWWKRRDLVDQWMDAKEALEIGFIDAIE